jgi:hypothetical protein
MKQRKVGGKFLRHTDNLDIFTADQGCQMAYFQTLNFLFG